MTYSYTVTKSDEWETPNRLFKNLNDVYGFDLDPCATKQNSKCPEFFTKETDGLKQKWFGTVFMNPPYSNIYAWTEKAFHELKNCDGIVMLLPVRTDTRWFHEHILEMGNKANIHYKRGRLRFSESNTNAPFPCFIIQCTEAR